MLTKEKSYVILLTDKTFLKNITSKDGYNNNIKILRKEKKTMITITTTLKRAYLAPLKPYVAYHRWSICVGKDINGILE